MLPDVCSGPLFRSGIVKDELDRGAVAFGRAHQDELRRGSPRRSYQLVRFSRVSAALKDLGVQDVRLTLNSAHDGAFRFFACCVDDEGMDPGEAESFALAAMCGWTIYTDDWQAIRAIDRFNANRFRCPPYGKALELHRPVPVRTTAWLLLEATFVGVLTPSEAEEAFWEMREVWDRHPQQTLAQLRSRGAAA